MFPLAEFFDTASHLRTPLYRALAPAPPAHPAAEMEEGNVMEVFSGAIPYG